MTNCCPLYTYIGPDRNWNPCYAVEIGHGSGVVYFETLAEVIEFAKMNTLALYAVARVGP